MTFPTIDQLRTAGLELRIGAAMGTVPGAATVIEGALRLERYHLHAEAAGVSREQADEILRDAQGLQADSTPTAEELAEATRLLSEAAR
jgi:hypothetical protein